MPRPKITLKEHLSAEEIKTRYRYCKDPKEARRWHALWLVSQGFPSQEAGRLTGLQGSWVRRIVNAYNKSGPESLMDGHRRNPGGARPRLNPEQVSDLRDKLKQPPPDGGRWTGPKVAAWIEELTNKKTHPQLGWVYLKNLTDDPKVKRRRRDTRMKAERRDGRSGLLNDTKL